MKMEDPAWIEFQKRLSLLMDSFYALLPEDKPQAIGSLRESICQMQSALKQQLCSDAMRTVAAMAESLIQETYGIQPINKGYHGSDFINTDSIYTQLDQSNTDSNDILTSALFESLKAVGSGDHEEFVVSDSSPAHSTTPVATSVPNYQDIIDLNVSSCLNDKANGSVECMPSQPTNFCNVQETENECWSKTGSLDIDNNDRHSSCNYNGTDSDAYNLHTVGDNALSEGCLLCTVCSFKTRFRQNLHRHMRLHKTTMGVDRPFGCKKCVKRFKTASSLKEHEVYVHCNDKTLKCPQCEKLFAIKKDLNRHLKSHSDERAFVCHCGKAYKSKYHLSRHVISSHNNTN